MDMGTDTMSGDPDVWGQTRCLAWRDAGGQITPEQIQGQRANRGTDTVFGLTDAGGLIAPGGSGRRLRFHLVNKADIGIAGLPGQKARVY